MFEWSEVCGARPAVMGIVNVTPDSFSDGGRWLDADAAVAHGFDLVEAGADLLDVGGESTRPGAEPVDAAEEQRRVIGVIERLAAEAGVPISVDTTKAIVAEVALAAGARIVNDVSAGRFDPGMLATVADHDAGFVAMHMQGEPRTMQVAPHYDDVVREVGDFLAARIDAALSAGVAPDAIAVDPGIGFGKTTGHNLTLLAQLDELVRRFAQPVTVGASRKRFLGQVLTAVADEAGEVPADRRDDATLATSLWAVELGARVLRVHDARSTARTIALWQAINEAQAA
jgi:dihydropteroate synthase